MSCTETLPMHWLISFSVRESSEAHATPWQKMRWVNTWARVWLIQVVFNESKKSESKRLVWFPVWIIWLTGESHVTRWIVNVSKITHLHTTVCNHTDKIKDSFYGICRIKWLNFESSDPTTPKDSESCDSTKVQVSQSTQHTCIRLLRKTHRCVTTRTNERLAAVSHMTQHLFSV